MMVGSSILVRNLGKQSYRATLEIQERLSSLLKQSKHLPEGVSARPEHTLLLVEHNPPVYTTGRKDSDHDLLITEKEIESKGAQLIKTNRGGKVTWHGPGQLVVYPILDLADFNKNVTWYVSSLQQVVIETLTGFGIQAHTTADVGVWVEKERKIASVGVSLSRWVTMHGFALNVNNDLSWYKHIIPCGLPDKQVTSMSQELQRNVTVDSVIPILLASFSKVFNRPLELEEPLKNFTNSDQHLFVTAVGGK